MIVEVRLFAGLARYSVNARSGEPFNVVLEDSDRIADLLGKLGIPEREAYVTMVNGIAQQHTAQLQSGDRVGIFPAVGGG